MHTCAHIQITRSFPTLEVSLQHPQCPQDLSLLQRLFQTIQNWIPGEFTFLLYEYFLSFELFDLFYLFFLNCAGSCRSSLCLLCRPPVAHSTTQEPKHTQTHWRAHTELHGKVTDDPFSSQNCDISGWTAFSPFFLVQKPWHKDKRRSTSHMFTKIKPLTWL